MTSVKNISNWPNAGGKIMNMTQNSSFSLPKGNFPGKKLKTTEAHEYAQNIT